MRRRLLAVIVALVAAVAVPARPAPADVPGCADNVADFTVPVGYGADVPQRGVRVILPEGYDTELTTHYPVLVLLHGAGDTFRTWVENTDVEELCDDFDPGLIIVMPDGGRGHQQGHVGDAGWYSNWVQDPVTTPPTTGCPAPPPEWEDFHVGALLAWVDDTFRTLGDGHRAIAGLSMGGFGALSYAGRHPGLFEVAASFSGAVNTMYRFPASGPGFELLHERFGTPTDCVWGDQLLAEAQWRAHNPKDLVAALAGLERVFLAWGDGVPQGPVSPAQLGGYGTEAFIDQMHRDPAEGFVPALEAAAPGKVVTRFTPGAAHDWPHWEAALHWAVPQMVPFID